MTSIDKENKQPDQDHGDPRRPPFPMAPDPIIELYKQDLNRTLLRENLKLTVEQRFVKLMELQRFADELKRAGEESRSSK